MLNIYTFKDTGRINCRDFFHSKKQKVASKRAPNRATKKSEIISYVLLIQIDLIWYLRGEGQRPNRSTSAGLKLLKRLYSSVHLRIYWLSCVCGLTNTMNDPLQEGRYEPLWMLPCLSIFSPVFNITNDTVRTVTLGLVWQVMVSVTPGQVRNRTQKWRHRQKRP